MWCYGQITSLMQVLCCGSEESRFHNIRGRGEYPTSLVWPNPLRKVMTKRPVITLGVEPFDLRH